MRRLRRELGLNQSAMAAEIGISPSYLNHLERNQRPVTAPVLLRMAESLRRRSSQLRGRGRRGDGRRPARRDLRRPAFRRYRHTALRIARSRRQCARRRRRGLAALRVFGREAAASGRRSARRGLSGHARSLGAGLHSGPAQPFRLSGGGRRDIVRGARRSLDHVRAASAAAQGRVRGRYTGRAAGAARIRRPSITTCTASG